MIFIKGMRTGKTALSKLMFKSLLNPTPTKLDSEGETHFKNTHLINIENAEKLNQIGIFIPVNDGEYCYAEYEPIEPKEIIQ